MPGELLIAAGPGEWRAAWAENGEPVELCVERGDTKPAGSIHLGRVVRLVSALDAALVDIGDERPGFLPLRELADTKPEEGARLLVQVRREAWQDKAPRLTGRIAAPDLPALAARAALLKPPAQLFPPPGFAAALALRLPGTPEQIVADDAAILAELRGVFPGARIASHANDWPVDLDAAFDEALAPTVALRGGGSVHFDETRAATLIDVDTGTPEAGSSERAALAANRAAATLIARQLRLRNIGGAVVVDFVGLDRRAQRERVRLAFDAALAGDPAKPQLLGWTRLGHIELVRPRRGRSLAEAMLEPRDIARQPAAIAHEALRRVLREARATPAANWRLVVSPGVEAALLHGAAAPALRALEARLGRRIAVSAEPGHDGFDIRPV
jgi:Ribonuclease G/E